VQAWLDFGRGPLFRLCFALMLLGLARIVLLTAIGVAESYRRSPDKILPWKTIVKQTFGWLVPVGRLWNKRPIYSAISVLFHAGLLLVPLFLAAHVLLWKQSVGFAWAALPQPVADWLTLLTLGAALGLLLGRAVHAGARALSRFQDYAWLVLLAIPFATGYVCSHGAISSKTYQTLMLFHVYAADLVVLLVPFTKIAHCVLAPLSQLVTGVAWKFPAGAGDRVAATLGYAERPCWVPKARLAESAAAPVSQEKVQTK
jgi:nitrate reductase gamma subunit